MASTDSSDGAISRRTLMRTAAAGVAGGTVASSPVGAQASTTIDMTDTLVYEPASVEVAPGTTVVWENVGNVPHSVTAYEDEIPDDVEYWASGGFGSEDEARSAYPDGAIEGGARTSRVSTCRASTATSAFPTRDRGWSPRSPWQKAPAAVGT